MSTGGLEQREWSPCQCQWTTEMDRKAGPRLLIDTSPPLSPSLYMGFRLVLSLQKVPNCFGNNSNLNRPPQQLCMSVITTNYLENVTERNAKLRKITHKLWKLNPEFKRQGLLREGFSALRGGNQAGRRYGRGRRLRKFHPWRAGRG